MCLYPETYESIYVTDHDIVVYKILRLDNSSIIQNFLYEPHRLYHGPALSYHYSEFDPYEPFIEEGFHAYVDKLAAERNCIPHSKVVAFTIPKGAAVCYGWFDDIVSDTIIAGPLEGKPPRVHSSSFWRSGAPEVPKSSSVLADMMCNCPRRQGVQAGRFPTR